MIVQLTPKTSYDYINKTGISVVVFIADFCDFFCHELLEQQYKNSSITIGVIDIDSGDELCKILTNKQLMPVFAIFMDGKYCDQMAGFHSYNDLISILKQYGHPK